MQSIRESASTEDYTLNKLLILPEKGENMIKYAMIKAILSALAVTAPIAETTYLYTGIYYSDIHEGEEWGYDAELADGTPVIITFDSQNTDSRYDDVITGLTEIKG